MLEAFCTLILKGLINFFQFLWFMMLRLYLYSNHWTKCLGHFFLHQYVFAATVMMHFFPAVNILEKNNVFVFKSRWFYLTGMDTAGHASDELNHGTLQLGGHLTLRPDHLLPLLINKWTLMKKLTDLRLTKSKIILGLGPRSLFFLDSPGTCWSW